MNSTEAVKIKVGRLNGPTTTVEEAEMALNLPWCGKIVGYMINGRFVRLEKEKPQCSPPTEASDATDGRV